MNEIFCPECSSRNAEDSKFCSNCGAPLGEAATIVCPSCDSENPGNLLYCDNCGTRLVDRPFPGDSTDQEEEEGGTRSKPFSLPTRPAGQTGDLDVSADLPDWLKTGESSASEEEPPEETTEWLRAAREDEEWQDEDAPTLDQLSGDHAPQDDLPDWLIDDAARDDILRGEKDTDELFMASFSGEEEPTPRETGSLLEGELPEWLQGLSSTGEEPVRAAQELNNPDAGEEEEQPPAPETATGAGEPVEEPGEADAASELQSWLNELEQWTGASGESEAEEGGAEAEPAGVPHWPSELEQEELEASESDALDRGGRSEVPDWLAEFDEDDVEGGVGPGLSPESSEDEAEQIPEDDFLEWLDTLDEAQRQEGTDAGGDEVDGEAAETPAQYSPDAESETAAPGAEGAMPGEEDTADAAETELPDWVGELSKEADEADEGAAALFQAGQGMPDWMRERPSTQSESQTEPPGEPREAEPASEARAEEVAGEEPPADEEALPEWLSGVTPELDPEGTEDAAPGQERAEEGHGEGERVDEPLDWQDADIFQPETEEEGPGQVVQAEDLPDWFSDVMDDITVEDEPSVGSPRKRPELDNVPPQLAGRELPEWLDSPFIDESVAEPTPLEEIPEWLRSPLQANLSRAAEDEELALDDVESSDEWDELLSELPQVKEGEEDLAAANIPEWLQALKPKELGGTGAEQPELPEETSGPLAGLRDVIAIAPVVAEPRRAQRPDRQAISGAPEQQVALLRQLTRADYRRVAVTEGPEGVAAAPWIRLALALLLLAAVIAGLLYPNLWAGAGTSQSGAVPGLDDVLSEASGRPVVVAFEYTPAMAGALAPEATAILRELNERNSNVLFMSQSPAGVAMARQALVGIDGLLTRELGYIPGGPIALRRIANCLSQEGDCQTVYGPELDAGTQSVLGDAALIIVLAGDQDGLISWIEQVGANSDVPLMAVVTPAVAPLATPYYASGQLAFLLNAGGPGVAGTGLETARSQGMVTSLVLSRWVVATAIFLGALFYLLAPVFRRLKA